VNADVDQAIQRLADNFPDAKVEYLDDDAGGAFVRVEGVVYGAKYTPSSGWIGVHVTSAFPRADPYPQFVCDDLARADGCALGEGFAVGQTMPGFDVPAVQVSRRGNHWNPATDTLSGKLARVLDWMHRQ
jgi:hypothetical protein